LKGQTRAESREGRPVRRKRGGGFIEKMNTRKTKKPSRRRGVGQGYKGSHIGKRGVSNGKADLSGGRNLRTTTSVGEG